MKTLFAFLLVTLLACSPKFQSAPLRESENNFFPWQTWTTGLTLDRTQFLNRFIERGDELHRQGHFLQAVDAYYLAADSQQSLLEKESLYVRIASSLLAADQTQKSLSVLSEFYEVRGKTVNLVRSEAGIVFGYVYGRLGNFNQSLAWFSQSLREAKNIEVETAAKKGALLLLRRIIDKDFYALKDRWQSDPFLGELFSEENHRRMNTGGEVIPFTDNPRFWETEVSKIKQKPSQKFSGEQGNGIIVLLPLSGRYSVFGKSMQRGIELAFSGQKEKPEYIFQDTQSSAARAGMVCHQLGVTGRYKIIIGPLLYSPSLEVAQCVRRYGMKMISFTKKSEFKESEGVYRIGMTVTSQIRSLIQSLIRKLGYSKFAVMLRSEETQNEFAEKFLQELSHNDLKPVFEYTYYTHPIPDFADLLEKVLTYKPQAIFLADDLNMAARVNAALGADIKESVRLIGTAEWSDLNLLQRSSNAVHGAVFVTPFLLEADEYSRKFSESFVQIYGQKPDFLAAQGYDVATIVSSLIEELKAGYDWISAMNNVTQYQGLTGVISVSPEKGFSRELKVVEYKNNRVQELDSGATPSFIYHGNEKVL